MVWRNVYCLLQMLSALTLVNSFNWTLENLSAVMASAINPHQKPCEDFYMHACGNWEKNFPRPHYLRSWSPDQMTLAQLYIKIREVLERPSDDYMNLQLNKERQFYYSCMDPGVSVIEGKKLFRKLVLEGEKARPRWQNVAEYFATKIGEISLLHITLDAKDQLKISEPYKIPATQILKGELRKQVLDNYLVRRKEYLIYDQEKKSNSFLMFESKFYNFLYSLDELFKNPESMYITVSIKELQELYENHCPSLNERSQINWLRLLQKLSGLDLKSSFKLVVDFRYVKGLCALLSQTEDDVIVRYLLFNFEEADETVFHLDKSNRFNGNAMSGDQRYVECIKMIPITTGFYEILADSEEFYQREEFFNRMVERIKYELKLEIKNSWMDDTSKAVARKRVTDLSLQISKLNFPLLKNEISSTSYNFEVTQVSLENWFNFKKAQTTYKFELSIIHSSPESRRKRSIEFNAYYNPMDHRIVFSPLVLFPPLFSLKAPISYNYARLGFIIGHEISHAFDYLRLTPRRGYTVQLKPELYDIFTSKLNCVVDQYIRLNIPKTTLVENMADIQGIKLAYKAMKRYFKDHPEAVGKNKFPQFQKLNDDEFFFISFANRICESRMSPMHVTSHSPNEMRVIGCLQNMKEFSKSFGCPKNTFMNPTQKCLFWEPIDDSQMDLCSGFDCLDINKKN